jgi:hypothetical protein
MVGRRILTLTVKPPSAHFFAREKEKLQLKIRSSFSLYVLLVIFHRPNQHFVRDR